MILLPIVYPTARQFWMSPHNLTITNKLVSQNRQNSHIPDKYTLCCDETINHILKEKYDLSYPLRYMASSAASRKHNQTQTSVVRPAGAKNDRFIYIDTLEMNAEPVYILIASPELCFLQAAKELSFIELVKFGFDLCARYISDDNEQYQQRPRIPVTNTAALQEFLSQKAGIDGIKSAYRALPYINNDSNSPMETKVTMLATFPWGKGGFLLKPPALNQEVVLSPKGAEIFGRKSCSCDIVWPEEKVAVEYDSHLVHLSADQHQWDLRKTLALEYSGYTVLRITADILNDQAQAEAFFLHVRKLLGVRPEQYRITKSADKRRELMVSLRGL